MKKSSLILLELNEITFPWVETYAREGYLPEFTKLFNDYSIYRTTSEDTYDNWEPWIQWVSVHTGKPFSEHGVFRLGDFQNSHVDQIWNLLESRGIKVGAVCPMNAINNMKSPEFFLPDPWTDTTTTGNYASELLSRSIKYFVNNNVSRKFDLSKVFGFGLAFLYFLKMNNAKQYLEYLLTSKNLVWRKALFLDRLLADSFITLQNKTPAQFSSLFLNAGAHIQHHYVYNSLCYDGSQSNPSWYIKEEEDPLLEAYQLYDKIIGDIRTSYPDSRLIVATGLSQDFYPDTAFYWRLLDHSNFLKKAKIENCRVEPRMSRDFVIYVPDTNHIVQIEKILIDARISGYGNEKIFEVDNRGDSLFVTLIWSKDISEDMEIKINGVTIEHFRILVGFVAIKNGHHNPTGYLIDTFEPNTQNRGGTIPVTDIFGKIVNHFV